MKVVAKTVAAYVVAVASSGCFFWPYPSCSVRSDGGSVDAADPCGNETVDPGEVCDGNDLGGASCETVGAFTGGTLRCADDCGSFDTSACVGPPTVPVLRKPMNGTHVGSVHLPGSLRPVFVWEGSAGIPAIAYTLEYSVDGSFAAGVVSVTTEMRAHAVETDLSVSRTAPVGARYYWRVRACNAFGCSEYSAAWYVDVGRTDHDFDGDGYADVLVGAPLAVGPSGGTGRLYVYRGGPGATFDTEPNGIVEGGTGEWLGYSVSPAGDVDADGFGDVVVGAPAAGANFGMAYLLFGGPDDSVWANPGIPLRGGVAGGGSGFAVGRAGDLNGDGFSDIVVGAPGDQEVPNEGHVYIYLGGPRDGFEGTPAAVLADGVAGDRFGSSVSTAGDVNGDGYSDIIVGAPDFGPDTWEGYQGRIYVYVGGRPGDIPCSLLTSVDGAIVDGNGERLGVSVASAGDVNDDGFSDLVVGAPRNEEDGPLSGRAYVYLGNVEATLNPVGDVALRADDPLDQLGAAVAPGGDLNGDGLDDVAVAAPHHGSGSGPRRGKIYFFLATPGGPLDPEPDGILTGLDEEDLGHTVASAGDVNADGSGDFVAGAPYLSRAYVYLSQPGSGFAMLSVAPLAGPGGHFGFSVH